jgi:predicted peroxiredoxin
MPVNRAGIVMGQADPTVPEKAAAPLVYALCARALDMEVEIHLTSTAVRWAFAGVAANAYSDQHHTQTILEYMRRAVGMGVKIYMCGMALTENHRGEAIIPEITGQTGATSVMAQMQRDDTRVLVF